MSKSSVKVDIAVHRTNLSVYCNYAWNFSRPMVINSDTGCTKSEWLSFINHLLLIRSNNQFRKYNLNYLCRLHQMPTQIRNLRVLILFSWKWMFFLTFHVQYIRINKQSQFHKQRVFLDSGFVFDSDELVTIRATFTCLVFNYVFFSLGFSCKTKFGCWIR